MKTIRHSLLILLIVATNHIEAQNFQWTKQFGNTFQDVGFAVDVDLNGNVYTTGYFRGTVDFSSSSGNGTLISNGGSDVFIAKFDSDGIFLWVKQFGSSEDDEGTSISIDNSGNIYTLGNYRGTTDFDPSENIFNLELLGETNTFISKLDTDGNFLWAKKFGGNGGVSGSSIDLDNLSNIYIIGGFNDTIDFDPGVEVFNLTNIGDNDTFITKLNTNGNHLWTKQFGGNNSVTGRAISIDLNGNVYTTGNFNGTADFDPSSSVMNISTANTYNNDIFISKLDTDGNYLWVKNMGGSTSSAIGQSIVVGVTGEIYFTGRFMSIVDFDPSPETFVLTSIGDNDIFISKFTNSGDFIWTKQIGGFGYDSSNDIKLDASQNIYTTGFFSQTVDFNPSSETFNLSSAGGFDIYVNKFDTDGNFLWAKQFAGTEFDNSLSLTVDSNNNVFTTGFFQGTVDFDPGTLNYNLTTAGNGDIFLNKLGSTVLNITENNFTTSLKAFPNPTNNEIFINLGGFFNNVHYSLVNINGQILEENNFENTNEISIKVNSGVGIYFLKVYSETGEFATIKIMKK